MTSDYFTLFSLTKEYSIDLKLLKSAYTALIAEHHPDNFANDEAKHLQALEFTNHVNQAYKTLSDAVLRGAYLLTLEGINAFDEYDTTMNAQFVMQQIELQEQLATLQDEKELEDFLDSLTQTICTYCTNIESAYSEHNFEQMKTLVRELKFYVQLEKTVQTKLDNFI